MSKAFRVKLALQRDQSQQVSHAAVGAAHFMDREAVRQRLLLPQVFLPGHRRRCQDSRNQRRATTAASQAELPRPRTVLAFR